MLVILLEILRGKGFKEKKRGKRERVKGTSQGSRQIENVLDNNYTILVYHFIFLFNSYFMIYLNFYNFKR